MADDTDPNEVKAEATMTRILNKVLDAREAKAAEAEAARLAEEEKKRKEQPEPFSFLKSFLGDAFRD